MSLTFKQSVQQNTTSNISNENVVATVNLVEDEWKLDAKYRYYPEYLDDNESTIDENKNINLNPTQSNVVQEVNAQIIPFRMNRYYDGYDLVPTQITILYQNKNGNSDFAVPINVYYNSQYIKFYWKLDNKVTHVAGEVKFEIHATGVNSKGDTYIWKSLPNGKLNVLQSLSYSGIEEPEENWIDVILSQSASNSQEAQMAAQQSSLYANDALLSAAEAAANKEETRRLIEGIGNTLSNFEQTINNNQSENLKQFENIAEVLAKNEVVVNQIGNTTNVFFENSDNSEESIKTLKQIQDFVAYINKQELLINHKINQNMLSINNLDLFANNLKNFIDQLSYVGAGSHNSIYRGKNLGSVVTEEQRTSIANGTFEDMYIGDYWVINDVTWRIASFDYYYNTGDVSCKQHHIVIVPDTNLYMAQMNNTASGEYNANSNTTDGAYVNSDMYKTNLEQAKVIINMAFGKENILNHRQYLPNATTDGFETGCSWYDSTVELMTEHNVFGGKIFKNATQNANFAHSYTIDKSQYQLFVFRPDMISNEQWYWLRDVAHTTSFCSVSGSGFAHTRNSSNVIGVRPAFAII